METIHGVTLDKKNRFIQRYGKKHSFKRSAHNITFKFLCNLVQLGPMTMEQHFEKLYGHLEDGGPSTGTRMLHILVHQLRPILLKLDLEIVAMRQRRNSSSRCVFMVVDCKEDVRLAA